MKPLFDQYKKNHIDRIIQKCKLEEKNYEIATNEI
jgi:hypothetical protein